jgi:hypothetical protein
MLAFIDESGDTGRKTEKGSSAYFVVSMVVFLDNEAAVQCDKRIDLLRSELNKPSDFEFHYSRNSKCVRSAFVNAVLPYDFSIISVAIDKDPSKLWGDGFGIKDSFYKYACHMTISNALPTLDNAIIIVDKSGSATFQQSLAKYLKNKFNTDENLKIKKVKQQDSRKNNLLQLADYAASITNRKLQGKNIAEHARLINTRGYLQIWPKD